MRVRLLLGGVDKRRAQQHVKGWYERVGSVNGSRKLTSWRQLKIDQFGVHSESVGSLGTRPRSRFLSR